MLSPTCLRQDPTVPSVTVSPSLGIVISCTTPDGTPTPGSSRAGMASEPPIGGAAGSFGAGPPLPAVPGTASAGTPAPPDPATTAGGPAVPPFGVEPGAPIRTRGVPTGTVSPSGTMISRITPS